MGDTHMTSTFRWGGGMQNNGKMRCYRTTGVGVSECSGRPIFIFLLLKKIGFGPWIYFDFLHSHARCDFCGKKTG